MTLVVVLAGLAVIVVVGVMILTQFEKRRTAALQAVAAAHGWSFSPRSRCRLHIRRLDSSAEARSVDIAT